MNKQSSNKNQTKQEMPDTVFKMAFWDDFFPPSVSIPIDDLRLKRVGRCCPHFCRAARARLLRHSVAVETRQRRGCWSAPCLPEQDGRHNTARMHGERKGCSIGAVSLGNRRWIKMKTSIKIYLNTRRRRERVERDHLFLSPLLSLFLFPHLLGTDRELY